MRAIAALFVVLELTLASPVLAQSSPGLTYGQVPTVAQWNSYFAAKQDVLGYSPVNRAGDTMLGRLVTAAPTNSAAGLNLPEGTAPGAPHNGDMWTTSLGLFVQIEGTTYGPLVGGSTTAGGDLSGTYPNPTVAKVHGVAYSASPSTNTVPVVTGSNVVTYEAVPNAALANSSMTIAGHSVTLGGTQAISCADLSNDAPSCSTDTTNAANISSGTLQAGRMPALSGDVTSSAGSTVTAIANNAVTNAKLAQMGAGTVKANLTGGVANATDSTPSQVLDTIGATQGNVLYRGASGWAVLAPGISGQVLSSGGAAANPSWITASGTGTVTSAQVSAGTGIAVSGTCTITISGNCTVAMANMPPYSVKCNPTGASGAPADCSGTPQVTAATYGASMSAAQTTATCTASSSTVTLASASDFKNNQGIALEHCGATFTGSAPTSVGVVAQESPGGATTYAYQLSCVDSAGGVGIATTAVTITNGPATLGTVVRASILRAHIDITWTQNAGCIDEAIWRSKSGGAYQLIAVTHPGQFNTVGGLSDYGLTQITSMPWIPATPPASALNDRLVSAITSGAGTTTLVLASTAGASTSGALTRHDDTSVLNNYFAAVTNAVIPVGTLNVETINLPSTLASLTGAGPAASKMQFWSDSATNVPQLFGTGMPQGFLVSGLSITALSFSAGGLEIDNTTNPVVVNSAITGGVFAWLENNDIGLRFQNNYIAFQFIGTDSLTTNQLSLYFNNRYGAGQFPSSGQTAILGSTDGQFCGNNLPIGGTRFGILLSGINEIACDNIIGGNGAEGIHVTSGVSNYKITGNVVAEGATNMDFCVSVSDDMNASSVQNGQISDNYIVGCGEAGIAIAGYGTAPAITNTVINGNFITGDNQDISGLTPCSIYMVGSNVSATYAYGNTVTANSHGTYAICDDGTAQTTTAGTNYGTNGSSAYYHFTGTGALINGTAAPSAFASIASACNAAAKGLTQTVTDSSTATWGAAIAGGGTNVVQANCNGTAWNVMAK